MTPIVRIVSVPIAAGPVFAADALQLLTESFHGFEHGGATGGVEAGSHSGDRERGDGQRGGGSNQLGWIESRPEFDARQRSHKPGRAGDPDPSAEQSEESSLHEKLKHNAAVGGADCFAQADFAGTVGDGDEHDVDDSYGAQGKGDQADATEEHVHRVKDLSDLVDSFDRVPFVESVRILWIKAMIAGDDSMDFLSGRLVQGAGLRLVVNEGDHVGIIAHVGKAKIFAHGIEGDEAPEVQVHVVAVTDGLDGADDLEADSVEQDGCSYGRAAAKESAPDFVANYDDRTFLCVIHIVDPATFVDGQVADLVEHGGDADDLTAGLEEVADGANVAAGDGRRRGANARALAQNVRIVTIGEVVLA